MSVQLPQDRSVISRHLQALEDSGILRSERQGRHRVYALDGEGFVERFDVLAKRLKELAPLCCSPRLPMASAAKKPSAQKTAAKKPAAKKPAAKKPATKIPATKKPAAKKPATKKPTTKAGHRKAR